MKGRAFIVIACVALGGCSTDIEDIGVAPHLTPVGSGVAGAPLAPEPVSFDRLNDEGGPLAWEGTSADLFRDRRARRVGDIITVNILIDDKAKLDNNSERSRDSEANASFTLGIDFMPTEYPVAGRGRINSDSSSESEGAIDRSEKINVSVAALVTEVLPNGNLVIRGSQEVRVNFEVRVLGVAGVIRPGDITGDNTIPYDKIAEARVSYGGRGRLSEIQQPAIGQQLFDLFTPF